MRWREEEREYPNRDKRVMRGSGGGGEQGGGERPTEVIQLMHSLVINRFTIAIEVIMHY